MPDQTQESCSRGNLLERLLDKLVFCLKAKNLPHFFIPENNMFHHYEDKDLLMVPSRVQDIQEHLLLYLTEDLFTTAVTEEFKQTYWSVI